jgi:hypothetical protein
MSKLYTALLYDKVYPARDTFNQFVQHTNELEELRAQLPRYLMTERLVNIVDWQIGNQENSFKTRFTAADGTIYFRDVASHQRFDLFPQEGLEEAA